ncbi:hypothetical protein VNI00_009768 [Paramarasmius palmivorus]|uniref:Uncharacterized protein n=1 Tax=Paramarasmius palmivorus TaxID=297713 RepID=A0AAW0CN93_9AGAR
MQHTDETPSCASTCLPETPQSGSDLPLILPSKEEKWKFWDSIFDMHLRWGSSFAWSPPNSSFLRSLEEPSWGSDEQELEVGEQDKPELLEHGLGLLALEDAAQSEQFGTEDESEERFNFFESDMGSTPISEDPEDISELPIITNGFFQDTNEGASPEEVRRRQIDDLRERLQEDPRYQYYRIMRPGDEETVLEELDYLHERTVTVNEGTFCVTLNNTLVYSVDDPDEVEDSHATPVEPPRQKPWGLAMATGYISLITLVMAILPAMVLLFPVWSESL